MSKATLYSLAGLGGATGIGGGAYLLHENSKASKPEKRTVRSKLEKAGFKILDPSDRQHWSTLKNEYNKVKQDSTKVFGEHTQDIEEGELKSLCQSFLEKDEGDESYGKSKRWCVVPVTVSSHLGNLGRKALSTADSGDTDKQQWESLASTYDNAPNKISGTDNLGTGQKWQTLRTKCKGLGDKKNYEDEFDTNLSSSITWCSIPF
ncbi:hypothetical protein HF1_08690 [Mycoplasma haemofelis str. Langford 1]|uniref:Uncharacterized protein n=1 Tax=Mycoplasma haemofelis (strain Langford 1) TaxID=941640 RepID=E8ZIA6_MYCHL|nr:hypothetical protein [Mycoplasma haemofelis]CBY92877.1 hypothetical protein HF1_08690 [Mycoplasma haemofelis str. Langford 1]